jgi:hypothetical protein
MNDKQTIRAWLKVHRTQLPMYLLSDPAFMAEHRDYCRYERIRTFSIIAVVLTILILSYSGCEAVDHGDPQFSSRVIPSPVKPDDGADYTGARFSAPGLAASAGTLCRSAWKAERSTNYAPPDGGAEALTDEAAGAF